MMGLNVQKGNMYPWVTHTWNPIRGRCPHACTYCYMHVFDATIGELRLAERELDTPLGEGRTIFIGSSVDMFATAVPTEWIQKVLEHCIQHPANTYLFQSKNPARFLEFAEGAFPPKVILGTTIETNRYYNVSRAPHPIDRINAMAELAGYDKMVSIEPIMDFDLHQMASWMEMLHPKFVSIGADSQGHSLQEPSGEKIAELIGALGRFTEVREKSNLQRLKKFGVVPCP